MTRAPGHLAKQGAAIVAAQLRGDHAERDRLITAFVRERGFPELVDAFSYAAIAAIEIAADAKGLSFESALDLVDARYGTGRGRAPAVPWRDAVRLVAAVKEDDGDAAGIRSTMDVDGAVRSTFQLAFAAFLTMVDAAGPDRSANVHQEPTFGSVGDEITQA